jgi:hypothetical protein
MAVLGSATLTGAALTGVTLAGTLAAPSHASASANGPIQHVLIMSVDGLHQNDAIWFVDNHPRFAPLLAAGVVYADAQTAVPADSLAGAVT